LKNFTRFLIYLLSIPILINSCTVGDFSDTYTVLPNPAATVVTIEIAGNLALTVHIAGTSAIAEGNVTDQGTSPVTERGICWNTAENPTIEDTHMASGSGPGVFNVNMTALTFNTVYYVRAYANNLAGTTYGSQVDFNSGHPFTPAVIFGGYVFYNDGSGGGLVASNGNLSLSQEWITGGATQTTLLNIPTRTGIGTGQANTTAIMSQPGHGGSAASLCDSYISGIYSDWYLPSQDELDLMYLKLHTGGIGGFNNVEYWSSSESNNTDAWCKNFGDSNQYTRLKSTPIHVRAARNF
jgi:hypothetical protein